MVIRAMHVHVRRPSLNGVTTHTHIYMLYIYVYTHILHVLDFAKPHWPGGSWSWIHFENFGFRVLPAMPSSKPNQRTIILLKDMSSELDI